LVASLYSSDTSDNSSVSEKEEGNQSEGFRSSLNADISLKRKDSKGNNFKQNGLTPSTMIT